MVPPRRVAPGSQRGRRAAARGCVALHSEGKGALARGRAVEGPRPTQIGGGRVHVGAWRPHARPGRAMCAGLGASSRPPAGRLARAGDRKEGRRPPRPVRAASPRRRRAGATPSAHGDGGGWAAGAAERAARTQPPSRQRRPRVSAGPGGRGGDPGQQGAGGPGLTSVPIAGRSVPGRGTTIGGAAARGGTAAAAAPAARRAGGAGAAAWAARRPELAPRCRRSRWRAQPARHPTGFLH